MLPSSSSAGGQTGIKSSNSKVSPGNGETYIHPTELAKRSRLFRRHKITLHTTIAACYIITERFLSHVQGSLG